MSDSDLVLLLVAAFLGFAVCFVVLLVTWAARRSQPRHVPKTEPPEDVERKKNAWFARLREEWGRAQADVSAQEAVAAAEKLTVMVQGLFAIGSVAFNEQRFRDLLSALWERLQEPSFKNYATLHAHLNTILSGYARGWETILSSGCEGPQFFGGGFGIVSAVQGMLMAHFAQTVSNHVASQITNKRAQQGMIELARSVEAYAALQQIVGGFNRQ